MTSINYGETWEVLINNSAFHKEDVLYPMKIIDFMDDVEIVLSEPDSPITYRFKKENVRFINKKA